MNSVKKDIYKQVKNITSSLIASSFSIRYNFPSDKGNTIAWSGFTDISFVLKNLPYEELYNECVKDSAYNFMLIDGAIIQMMYEFDERGMTKQRLAFYPNPVIERYQDSIEDFEELYYGNQLFADIFDKKIITFPLRIDFDNDPEKYIEHNHSYAHLTLGNYKNCRIPINKPLSPNKFILFILKSFYFDRFVEYYSNDDFRCSLLFSDLLSVGEKNFLHVNH